MNKELLSDLLKSRSPSGYEGEAQSVIDKHIKPIAEQYFKDTIGNRYAIHNQRGEITVMFSGHIDEIALSVAAIDPNGFIHFDYIGGHDNTIPSGRRVKIITQDGEVSGVVGKKAIHLMTDKESAATPKRWEMWIDIGVKNKEEAEKLVRIGDPIVYDYGFEIIRGTIATARAFDDKAGTYICMEAFRRLTEVNNLNTKVVSVATTQEEIGLRGAQIAAQKILPQVAIAVDVTHATDHPEVNTNRFGNISLSGGPVISRGPNLNPLVVNKMIQAAKNLNIPYQLESAPYVTGTDAGAIQMAGNGVATGLLSIPLRYMHTPSEVIDLNTLEQCVQLLVEFVKLTQADETFEW